MELTTEARILLAFYRLLGEESGDLQLVAQGEGDDDVAYLALTRGARQAQRWMLDMGYGGWRQRSSALSWSGTDSTTGGTYSALPTDWLKLYGNFRRSALVEANGDRWGQEINPEDDHLKGNLYYVRGEQIWLARTASPPTTLYVDYHYKHPTFASGITVDFPMDARSLIVGEAGVAAMDENWLLGGPEMEAKILAFLERAREQARHIARATKQPRQMRKPLRVGNRY